MDYRKQRKRKYKEANIPKHNRTLLCRRWNSPDGKPGGQETEGAKVGLPEGYQAAVQVAPWVASRRVSCI